jgi:general nucleoside transport system permease protein
VSARAATALELGRDRIASPRTAAGVGVFLGLFAFWLALPPVATRSIAVPVVVGGAAIAIGLWLVTRGDLRPGWSAVAAGLVGVLGGIFATRAATTHLDAVVTWSALVAATLRFATPLTFAAMGGMFSERSGVVNIGLEGMMLMGAFFAAWGADVTNSWAGGLLIGMGFGAALAFVHAVFSIHLRADQIVSGTAVNFLALGITGYFFNDIYGNNGTPDNLAGIPDVHLGFLAHIPPHGLGSFLGDSFGQLNLMVWLSLAVLVLSYIVMFKTTIGLRIRSVGEHPRAADTVGISVYGVRYACVTLSGALAAMGGAFLSIGFVHSFAENMTAGRGFIALAALIFGRWRPFGAFGAALLFGFASAVAPRLELVNAWSNYGTLFQILPYVLTLIAVAGVIGRSIPPAAVGRPYAKQ